MCIFVFLGCRRLETLDMGAGIGRMDSRLMWDSDEDARLGDDARPELIPAVPEQNEALSAKFIFGGKVEKNVPSLNTEGGPHVPLFDQGQTRTDRFPTPRATPLDSGVSSPERLPMPVYSESLPSTMIFGQAAARPYQGVEGGGGEPAAPVHAGGDANRHRGGG